MDRRAFVITAAGLLAAPLAAEAQAGKVWRIGYLSSSSAIASQDPTEVFRQALRGLGWVEGQNIVIDYRFAMSGGTRNSPAPG
jgi:putative ABC transport system substrate-binding protein